MEIRKTETPSRELLLLADEVEASVADYIGRGTCYAACDGGRIVGQYVLIHTRPFTAEVVNIAVVPDRQRQGIATALLAHAVDTARRAGFRLLEIGTGNSGFGQIALYERCGFVRCGIDVDYFRKHSPTPIFENGVECRHGAPAHGTRLTGFLPAGRKDVRQEPDLFSRRRPQGSPPIKKQGRRYNPYWSASRALTR